MREDIPGAFSKDPECCLCDVKSVGDKTLCSLAGLWVNCRKMGCHTAPDGSHLQGDNSPEARARRLRRMNG